MAQPNKYTEKVYGIDFRPITAYALDTVWKDKEPEPVYLCREDAIQAIRAYHQQLPPVPDWEWGAGANHFPPIGVVYERYISPEQKESATANPDLHFPVRNARGTTGHTYPAITAVISADKHTPETVITRDESTPYDFSAKIHAAINQHTHPFYQSHFEATHPIATYSDDPKYTLYIVDTINEPKDFTVSQRGTRNAQVYATYDSALLAASTKIPTYARYHATQDKHWEYGAKTPYPHSIRPVQVPVEQYQQLQEWIHPNGYVCTESHLDEHQYRAYEGQSWRESISTIKIGDIQTVVFGADKQHEAVCYTVNTVPHFEIVVRAEAQKRATACQELAQHQWDDAHPTPEKLPYQSAEERHIATNDVEVAHPDETNAGWKLISRWAKTLEETGHADAAKELVVKYSQNVERLHDYNDETKRSAYRAMETVFGKVHREAVKCGDFETATAAQHVVRGAQSALDDMRLGAENQRAGITKEEAAEYGIYVEEEEVCV